MTDPVAPNPSTAQAVAISDELVRAGVRHIVLAPGSRSGALAIALDSTEGLRVHVHPDERSAAFVALGIGRSSATPAAVVVTSGTAVANLLPATVEADRSGTPLILLTADRPPELRDTGANQTVEQLGMLGRGLRWTAEIPVAEDRADAVRTWRAVTARAVAVARGDGGSLPGPVHLNIPTREPTAPVSDDGRSSAEPFLSSVDGRPDRAPWVRVLAREPEPSPFLVAELAERLAGVPNGLIVVGGPVGSRDRPAAAATDAISAALGWPVIAEVMTAARAGVATLAAGSWLLEDRRFSVRNLPAMVLRVGRPTLRERWTSLLGARVPQILIDPYGGWHDPGRSIADIVVADPEKILGAIARVLNPGGRTDRTTSWGSLWREADRRAREGLTEVLDEDGPLSGLHVARAVGAAVPASVPLVAASSLAVRDLDATHVGRPGIRVHANRGAAGIDGTVSTSLGVALGGPGRAWCLIGDLALLHDTNGLLLQAEPPVPEVTIVAVDNSGGRIFTGLPASSRTSAFERLFVAPTSRDLATVGTLHRLPVNGIRTVAGLASIRTGTDACLHVATVDPGSDAEVRERVATAVSSQIGAVEG